MKYFFLYGMALLSSHLMSAYESAFPKTDVGQIEIKTIPAARLIATHSERHYFEANNALFRRLFRYIQANDIAMTTPVEAVLDPAGMYFYLGGDVVYTALEDSDEVSLIEYPERIVLSIGVRGSYNAKHFNQARDTLLTHLATQNKWIATGPARAIYWNGPFMPGVLKRSEVHIPVKPAPKALQI